MKNINWLFILVVVALAACNSAQDNGDAAERSTESTPKVLEQNIPVETKNTVKVLQLNKGEKWSVNQEMMPHIQASEELLKAHTPKANHQVLAASLKEKNDALIGSCTMKGQSHDQLHKWLIPHLQLVKELNQAETTEKAQEIIKQLSQSFKTFNTYFQ
jgi:glycine cleavage system protein P-like pyridoxal-binding family